MKRITAIILRNGYAIFAMTNTLPAIERKVRSMNTDSTDFYSYVVER